LSHHKNDLKSNELVSKFLYVYTK